MRCKPRPVSNPATTTTRAAGTVRRRLAPAAAVAVMLLTALAPGPRAARLAALDQWQQSFRDYEYDTLRPAEGLAPTDFARLIEAPAEISFGADAHPSDDIYAVTFADIHAVYPVPLEALRETILDFDSHKEFVPRVVSSDAQRTADNPPSWRQHVELSFRLLIFGADYSFETKHIVSQQDEDRFALVFRMLESHDKMLADSGGSWYLKRIEIDNEEHTYVRYFNHVAFGLRIFGLRFALRNFGLRDVKSVMDAYYERALTLTR